MVGRKITINIIIYNNTTQFMKTMGREGLFLKTMGREGIKHVVITIRSKLKEQILQSEKQ